MCVHQLEKREIVQIVALEFAYGNAMFSYLNRLSACSVKCLSVHQIQNVIKSTYMNLGLIKINFFDDGDIG